MKIIKSKKQIIVWIATFLCLVSGLYYAISTVTSNKENRNLPETAFTDTQESAAQDFVPLRNIGIAEFRNLQCERPLNPYLGIDGREVPSPEKIQNILITGWLPKGVTELLCINPPVNWEYKPNRNCNFQLHAFEPVNLLLLMYNKRPSQEIFNAALAFTLDWIDNFADCYQGGIYRRDSNDNFAWYDMAVGRRFVTIAYLMDVAARNNEVSNEKIQKLWKALLKHMEYLDVNENIVYRNNHGFFQLAGQMDASKRFSWHEKIAKVHKRAKSRMKQMINLQFSSEGLHREHSPEYQRFVLNALNVLFKQGIFEEDSSLMDLFKNATSALESMWMPDGGIVPFGDSDRLKVVKDVNILQETVSTSPEIMPFPDSGFWAFRQYSSEQQAVSYLALQAAFHSRMHKHADDLAIVWYDRNTLIFTDAGKYGYYKDGDLTPEQRRQGFWYSDPKRMYVESTRAHTTVEINGRNHDRVKREPYGSGLLAWGTADNGIVYTSAKVPHSDGYQHTRFIILLPSQWLLLIDWIESEKLKAENNYRQWFQLGPDLEAKPHARSYKISGKSLKAPFIAVSLVPDVELMPPVWGQEKPQLQGWHSPKVGLFEPITSLCFELNVKGNGTIVTLFAFSNDVVPEETRLFEDNGCLNADISWAEQRCRHSISIKRLNQKEPTIHYMKMDELYRLN